MLVWIFISTFLEFFYLSSYYTCMKDIKFQEKIDFRTQGLMSRKEMARYLSISQRKLSTMMTNREIPFIKSGRLVRFNLGHVLDALQRFTIEAD